MIESDLRHLKHLYNAATSDSIFKSNPVLFKVAVNDYRYYKSKFIQKHKQSLTIECGQGMESKWKFIKHPYIGKTKIGFKTLSKQRIQIIEYLQNKIK